MASIQELEARLLTYKASTPEFPIVVKGDSAVQYQKVMEVLDLLGRIDLNQIGLVTQRLVK
jgi:biopolymer transport protein ExbD